MNKHLLCSAMLCWLTVLAWGQSQQLAQYSYISDRTFTSPEQLMGYDFKPAMREVPGEEPEEIAVGKYSFGITRKNLYVEGPEIRGVYSVNAINETEYGFILNTMNARDPTIQGHLKIVVDEIGQVEGLIFKRSTHEKEVIFFLRVIPAEVDAAEAEYFTNKGEKRVAEVDSLWTDVEVRPFLRVFQNMGGIQQRILPTDSVYLRFYKVVTVEEKKNVLQELSKGKKAKKRGLFGTRKSDDDVAVGVAADTMPAATVPTIDVERARAEQLAAVTGKPVEEYLTPVEPVDQETLLTDGFEEVAVDSIPLAQEAAVATDVDATNSTISPDSLQTSEGALTSTAFSADSLAVDSLGLALLDSLQLPTESSVDSSKLKITTKYYVDLNSFMRYDDGTSEMQHKTFLVNGMLERENPGARSGGDRYQWELNLHKRPNAYIYLDERYRVNSIRIDGQLFYMRGH